MKRAKEYGLLAVVLGVICIIFAIIATYADSIYYSGKSWFVFYWLDKFGLINNTPSTTPTISQDHLWTISEKNAIFWSYTISIACGVYSLIATFVAEYKREDTLLFSVGYILATFGFIILNLKLGVISLFVGFAIIMAIRKRNTMNSETNAN
jgi:hypothetical protein